MPGVDPSGGGRALIVRCRDYRAYGLLFRSDLELPFRSALAGGRADVRLRLGRVPDALPAPRIRLAPWLELAPGDFLMRVRGVARYRVTGGTEIVVDPETVVNDEVVSFLPGTVLGACLQQRGVITLHASAVATPAGAVLFAGRSGIGKSTLLAALTERGHAMLADDVTGIVLDADGRPLALAAYPTMRLWAHAMDEMGWERTPALRRVWKTSEKYLVPTGRFCDAAVPLRCVFVLDSDNRESVEIEAVAAAAKLVLLASYTYRARFVAGFGGLAEHFRVVAATANDAWLAKVTRPRDSFVLDALADRVEEYMNAAPLTSRAGCVEAG